MSGLRTLVKFVTNIQLIIMSHLMATKVSYCFSGVKNVYNLKIYKLYYKIQQEPEPHYFNHVMPTLTHHYSSRQYTRQYTLQQ